MMVVAGRVLERLPFIVFQLFIPELEKRIVEHSLVRRSAGG